MTVTFAERVGDELYVYVLGRLAMKRWLCDGVDVVFHVAPYGVGWPGRMVRVRRDRRSAIEKWPPVDRVDERSEALAFADRIRISVGRKDDI